MLHLRCSRPRGKALPLSPKVKDNDNNNKKEKQVDFFLKMNRWRNRKHPSSSASSEKDSDWMMVPKDDENERLLAQEMNEAQKAATESLKHGTYDLGHYASTPGHKIFPSEMTKQYEADWYKREDTFDPSKTDLENFTAASWQNHGKEWGTGDRSSVEHWKKTTEVNHFKTDASVTRCHSCKQDFKRYQLFKSMREEEEEWVAYDMPQRNTVRRCPNCELRIRVSHDLKKYSDQYDLNITHDELERAKRDLGVKHLGRKRFKKLNDAKVEVCIDHSLGTKVPVDYYYFSLDGVGYHVTKQTKSATWYKDGQNVAKAMRILHDSTIGETNMVRVNKMHVEKMCSPESQSIWDMPNANVIDKKQEEQLFLAGTVKPQTRTLEEMCPYVGPREIGSKGDHEVDLTKFVKYNIEFENDHRCDSRKCRVCKQNFQSFAEERDHRSTPSHVQSLAALEGIEAYECIVCKFESSNRKEFIEHLKSEYHVKMMDRVYQGSNEGAEIVMIGDFVARKLLRVLTSVYQHESIILMVGYMFKAMDQPFMQKFKLCMQQAATRMNVVAKLMDRVYDDDVIDEAMKEGSNSAATARKTYWEAADEIVESIQTYQTGVAQYGVQAGSREQAELLAVLDYSDEICDGMWLFNLCTSCGLAFGAKLWWQRDIGTSYHPTRLMHLEQNYDAFTKKTSKRKNNQSFYRCLCEWAEAKKGMEIETEHQRPDWATKMWNYNIENFGPNWEEWPIPGCGAGFKPFSNGPSMVVVLKVGDGYDSVQAARPPTVIHDTILAYRCDQVKQYVKNLDVAAIWKWLPAAFPLDSEYAENAGYTNKKFLGINKYPLSDWKTGNRPYLSETSWIVFTMILSAGSEDPQLIEMMDIAIGMYERDGAINREIGKKKLVSKAWYRKQAGAVVPKNATEVLQNYACEHPTISRQQFAQGTYAPHEEGDAMETPWATTTSSWCSPSTGSAAW